MPREWSGLGILRAASREFDLILAVIYLFPRADLPVPFLMEPQEIIPKCAWFLLSLLLGSASFVLYCCKALERRLEISFYKSLIQRVKG